MTKRQSPTGESPQDARKDPLPGQQTITVYDTAGRAHEVPLRPDGAYLQALERDTARRDAARPAEELLDELSAWTRSLHELQRGFTQRPS